MIEWKNAKEFPIPREKNAYFVAVVKKKSEFLPMIIRCTLEHDYALEYEFSDSEGLLIHTDDIYNWDYFNLPEHYPD